MYTTEKMRIIYQLQRIDIDETSAVRESRGGMINIAD